MLAPIVFDLLSVILSLSSVCERTMSSEASASSDPHPHLNLGAEIRRRAGHMDEINFDNDPTVRFLRAVASTLCLYLAAEAEAKPADPSVPEFWVLEKQD
jgi:hypothetical protein